MKHALSFLLLLTLFAFGKEKAIKSADANKIHINWVPTVEGDFSFTQKWSYPDGVYRNRFGQLSCDGQCPTGAERMKNKKGKIQENSLDAFYALVDTSHLSHSMVSEATAYEWVNSDFIEIEKTADGKIKGISLTNAATHSSLVMELDQEYCAAWIELNSIRSPNTQYFDMIEGEIKVDQDMWEKGILKATFDFTFENIIDSNRPIIWKGKIYKELPKP